MPRYKYQNISDLEQVLIGHGRVPAGGEITSATAIENANFKFLGEVNDDPETTAESASTSDQAQTENLETNPEIK
jgi:hypothetical protein